MKRAYESGCAKRKKQRRSIEAAVSWTRQVDHYFRIKTTPSTEPTLPIELTPSTSETFISTVH